MVGGKAGQSVEEKVLRSAAKKAASSVCMKAAQWATQSVDV